MIRAPEFLAVTVAFMLISACGNDAKQSGSSGQASIPETNNRQAMAVTTVADLPPCTAEAEGRLAWVGATSQFMTCQTGIWTAIDVKAAMGAVPKIQIDAEDAGDNCPAGGQKISTGIDANTDGTLAGAEATDLKYVCNGKEGLTVASNWRYSVPRLEGVLETIKESNKNDFASFANGSVYLLDIQLQKFTNNWAFLSASGYRYLDESYEIWSYSFFLEPSEKSQTVVHPWNALLDLHIVYTPSTDFPTVNLGIFLQDEPFGEPKTFTLVKQ